MRAGTFLQHPIATTTVGIVFSTTRTAAIRPVAARAAAVPEQTAARVRDTSGHAAPTSCAVQPPVAARKAPLGRLVRSVRLMMVISLLGRLLLLVMVAVAGRIALAATDRAGQRYRYTRSARWMVSVSAKFVRIQPTDRRMAHISQWRGNGFRRQPMLKAVSTLRAGQQLAVAALIQCASPGTPVPRAGTPMVRIPIAIVRDAGRRPMATRFAHRAAAAELRGTTERTEATAAGPASTASAAAGAMMVVVVVMVVRQGRLLPVAGIRVLLERLQLRQRDNITVLRSMPDGLL